VEFKVDCLPKELHKELGLSGAFPSVTIALRISVSLPTSVASDERTFRVLTQVRNYYRLTEGQDRLNGFLMLSINYDFA
jgi:hypothetical protein